ALRRGARGLVLELLALVRLGTIAATGDDKRTGAVGISEAEMQDGKPAHRDADDMRFREPQPVEHVTDIVARPFLRIARPVLGHVRGRIAARVEGDAAVAAREKAQLRLVTAAVAGEFMHEHNRVAGAGLLVIEADAVIAGHMGHRNSLRSDRVFILEAPAPLRQVAGNTGERGDFPFAAPGLQSPGRGRWREEKPMRSEREERIKERAYAIWLAEGRVH